MNADENQYKSHISNDIIKDIANKYGTPSYIYCTNKIQESYHNLRNGLPPEVEIFYSLKANPNISLVSYLRSLGCHADVGSRAELEFALMAGVAPGSIVFTGPGKTREDIERAVSLQIFSIVCESIEEARLIDELSNEKGTITNVSIRINPYFQALSVLRSMSGKASQFGFDERTSDREFEEISSLKNIRVHGIHVYMGSRNLDNNSIYLNTKNIIECAEKFSSKFGFSLEMLDIGGGFGVPYFSWEHPLDMKRLKISLEPLVRAFKIKHPNCRLIAESGRYLVAGSGILVTSVLYTKENHGVKYCIIDGGLNAFYLASDNLSVQDPSGRDRNFPVHLISKTTSIEKVNYNISGPAATPSDILAKNIQLPILSPNDLICFLNTGAYGPTASLPYFIGLGYPSEILLHEGNSILIRKRDSYQEQVRSQSPVLF